MEIMNERIENIVIRCLTENEFKINNVKYKFLYVKPYSDRSEMAFRFAVDITLPEIGQSYITDVFNNSIDKIFENISKLIGVHFSYSYDKMLINGEQSAKRCFISNTKINEILNTLNKKIKKTNITTKEFNLSFNVRFNPNQRYFYKANDVNIEFYFNLGVHNMKNHDKMIYSNMNRISDLGSSLSEYLNDDTDAFRSDVEEYIYHILETELQIFDADVYFRCFFIVDKIDGMETFSKNYGDPLDMSMFT